MFCEIPNEFSELSAIGSYLESAMPGKPSLPHLHGVGCPKQPIFQNTAQCVGIAAVSAWRNAGAAPCRNCGGS